MYDIGIMASKVYKGKGVTSSSCQGQKYSRIGKPITANSANLSAS